MFISVLTRPSIWASVEVLVVTLSGWRIFFSRRYSVSPSSPGMTAPRRCSLQSIGGDVALRLAMLVGQGSPRSTWALLSARCTMAATSPRFSTGAPEALRIMARKRKSVAVARLALSSPLNVCGVSTVSDCGIASRKMARRRDAVVGERRRRPAVVVDDLGAHPVVERTVPPRGFG